MDASRSCRAKARTTALGGEPPRGGGASGQRHGQSAVHGETRPTPSSSVRQPKQPTGKGPPPTKFVPCAATPTPPAIHHRQAEGSRTPRLRSEARKGVQRPHRSLPAKGDRARTRQPVRAPPRHDCTNRLPEPRRAQSHSGENWNPAVAKSFRDAESPAANPELRLQYQGQGNVHPVAGPTAARRSPRRAVEAALSKPTQENPQPEPVPRLLPTPHSASLPPTGYCLSLAQARSPRSGGDLRLQRAS